MSEIAVGCENVSVEIMALLGSLGPGVDNQAIMVRLAELCDDEAIMDSSIQITARTCARRLVRFEMFCEAQQIVDLFGIKGSNLSFLRILAERDASKN